jgi:adenine C2-methylase RlmN of 23S rRNA A2503 and tRNA A37
VTQEILRSKQDKSINFVTHADDGGKIEARFVQREEDTIIVYLSSMTGCNLSCRFCHLTQMHETTMTAVDIDGYLTQARDVLTLAAKEGKLANVQTVHFNFMARGDALSNIYFVNKTELLFYRLDSLSAEHGLISKFKISTIFPNTLLDSFTLPMLKEWVEQVYDLPYDVEFYYSLYSLDEAFRKRWIPKGMDPERVGYLFEGTEGKLRLHHALIDKENCSLANTNPIKSWLVRYDIKCRLNIVRYNPFNNGSGVEASDGDIRTYCGIMSLCPNILGTYVVSRVGLDVKASCGTFV